MPRWNRITVPLSGNAVGNFVQFRWAQASGSAVPWAIDNSRMASTNVKLLLRVLFSFI